MRMQRKRRKGGRTRRQHSELDWFAEDPWAETEGPAAPLSLTDWQQDLAYLSEDDLGDVESSGDEDWGEDEDGVRTTTTIGVQSGRGVAPLAVLERWRPRRLIQAKLRVRSALPLSE